MTRLALLVLFAVAAPLSQPKALAADSAPRAAVADEGPICITIGGEEYCLWG